MLLETLRYGKHPQNVNIETFCVECQYILSHYYYFCCCRGFKIHCALSLQRLLIVHIVNVFNFISLFLFIVANIRL
jgi:hypothetical protein